MSNKPRPVPSGTGNTRQGRCPQHGAYTGSHCGACADQTEHELRMADRRRKIEEGTAS